VNRGPPVLCPSVLAFYSIIGFSSLSKHLYPHRTRSSGPSDLQEGRDCTRNEIYDKSDDDLVNTPICLRWLKSGCGVCIDTAFVGSGVLAKVSFQPPRQWLTVLHSQSSRLVWCASPLFGVTLRIACVQPEPRSRFVVSGLSRYEDQKPQRVLRCLDSTPQSLNKHKTCGSQLADECGVAFTFDETGSIPSQAR
jgi:hypothetical protein